MGYVRSKHLTFRFEDDPILEGLVVRTRRVSIEIMREIMRLDREKPEDIASLSEEEMFAAFERPFDIFSDALVSWNLQEEDDDGGEPADVPATKEALLADVPWGIRVVRAWMRGVTSVSRGLGKDSPSGATSPPPSLPMEPLSESPESSLTPS